MAPEQREGCRDLDGRADLYALAVMTFELLRGRVPVGRATLNSHHAGLDALFDAAYAHDRAERPASARAARALLGRKAPPSGRRRTPGRAPSLPAREPSEPATEPPRPAPSPAAREPWEPPPAPPAAPAAEPPPADPVAAPAATTDGAMRQPIAAAGAGAPVAAEKPAEARQAPRPRPPVPPLRCPAPRPRRAPVLRVRHGLARPGKRGAARDVGSAPRPLQAAVGRIEQRLGRIRDRGQGVQREQGVERRLGVDAAADGPRHPAEPGLDERTDRLPEFMISSSGMIACTSFSAKRRLERKARAARRSCERGGVSSRTIRSAARRTWESAACRPRGARAARPGEPASSFSAGTSQRQTGRKLCVMIENASGPYSPIGSGGWGPTEWGWATREEGGNRFAGRTPRRGPAARGG